MRSLFIMDVDTQRDFMHPGGALYVPGAERMIPKLRRLFEFARRNGITVVSTADAHAPDDPEFAEFPPHCVVGTEGQRKLGETLLPRPAIIENRAVDRNILDLVERHQQIIVQKNAIDVFVNPTLDRVVRALPQRALVFGVTTEYCIRHAALGLRRRGVKTVVVTDAICALAPDSGEGALREMTEAGIEFVTTDTLLALPSER